MPKKSMKAPRIHKQATASARAQQALRTTWNNTVDTLTSAEQQVEKQVKGLLKKNTLNVGEAADRLKHLQARVEKERKKGLKQFEARFKSLQARAKKERHNVAKLASEAVQSTLAALNIPSRHEVAELTRKVDELSRRIDRLRKK